MWSDVAFLKTFSVVLVWVAVVSGGLASISAWARYYVDRRANELTAVVKKQEELEKENAAKANDAALKKDLALQGREAEKVKLELAEQRKRGVELQEKLIESQNQQHEANSKLVKVEGKIQPRIITKEQRQFLIEGLRTFPGKKKVIINVIMGNSEALSLALSLESIFTVAGWESSGVSQTIFNVAVNDVILFAVSEHEHHPCVPVLGSLLNKYGIAASGLIHPEGTIDELKIIIGPKSKQGALK